MDKNDLARHSNHAITIDQRLLEQRRALDEAAIVSETDLTGNITYFNDKFVEISGYSRYELIGQNHRIINSNTHNPAFFQHMWHTILMGDTWQGDICNRKKDGQLYWVKSTIVPIMDTNTHKPVRFQSIRFDITPQKELEQSLIHQTTTDPLTGINNRYALNRLFNIAKNLAESQNTLLAVCLIDLDDFKSINDQLGHKEGDQVLIQLALRLKHTLRDHDMVARLGGDEFALILNNLKSKDEINVCLHRLSQAIEQPLHLDGYSVTLSASLGVAIYPEHNDEFDVLIRQADYSMYLAKQKGKNQFVFLIILKI
ncbi:GGDEF domain-containing protein [Thiomicrorhabdus aquaedulcis]|uniref:GGDEF domain-containing protein n=1 Tax=Thiomicrorhabdus aquaedulcis TaxID=2211106 RepID=UPI000FD7CF8C|nr:GGDEF domain-containing protein [Thiomicrorhabdus aquaedulcis]